jgi:hypothetical protein
MTKPMDASRRLLAIYDALPALLDLAERRVKDEGGYSYGIQDQLREDYRRKGLPFRYSMLYRHLDSCDLCTYMNTAILHELENPRVAETTPVLRHVGISELDAHKVREHGTAFPADVQAFLSTLAEGDAPETGQDSAG